MLLHVLDAPKRVSPPPLEHWHPCSLLTLRNNSAMIAP